MSKLEKFKNSAWLGDNVDWYLEYRTVFEKVFHFYRQQNPAINAPSAASSALSGLDKAFYNILKRQKLSPSAATFKELKAYLDIKGTTGDFLTVATNGVSVKYLFNSSWNICYYCRSHLYPETIKALMLQMCTNRFTIDKEYQDILDNLTPDSITFTAEDQEDNKPITTFYISKNKDIDDLEDDPEDGSLLETEDPALPQSVDIT
ncbi:hypothetical protein BJX63DRAFT_438830 [Aspergillus granulosus]|uniref:Uncharacterized protein n=1 Tax=Aspergillus granulosus TaxID=176169 RepID=A0ABR4GSR0_9EURO